MKETAAKGSEARCAGESTSFHGHWQAPNMHFPFPVTIMALFKTTFQIDIPFDLPETFFFMFLG